MVLRVAFALILLAAGAGLHAKANDYVEGQVWEYQTRPQDPGSLIKIQKVNIDPERIEHRVLYHISIIGVHLNDPNVLREISHVPVSRETLDDSVTRLSASKATFPDAAEGIAEWRKAKGGVFTIPLAQIVDSVEQTMSKMPTPTQ